MGEGRAESEPNIEWLIGRAAAPRRRGRVSGLAFEDDDAYGCDALVITTGTFLNGLVHIGPEQPAGRAGEPPSRDLAESLKVVRFRVGTAEDWNATAARSRKYRIRALCGDGRFTAERGDDRPSRFIPFGRIERPQTDCHLLHTNDRCEIWCARTRSLSAVQGQIAARPRYCPSLEDKIVRLS